MRKIRETCGTLTPVWTPFDTDHWITFTLMVTYVFGFFVTVRCSLYVKAQIVSNLNIFNECMLIPTKDCQFATIKYPHCAKMCVLDFIAVASVAKNPKEK